MRFNALTDRLCDPKRSFPTCAQIQVLPPFGFSTCRAQHTCTRPAGHAPIRHNFAYEELSADKDIVTALGQGVRPWHQPWKVAQSTGRTTRSLRSNHSIRFSSMALAAHQSLRRPAEAEQGRRPSCFSRRGTSAASRRLGVGIRYACVGGLYGSVATAVWTSRVLATDSLRPLLA
jgi:hypothetical protein